MPRHLLALRRCLVRSVAALTVIAAIVVATAAARPDGRPVTVAAVDANEAVGRAAPAAPASAPAVTALPDHLEHPAPDVTPGPRPIVRGPETITAPESGVVALDAYRRASATWPAMGCQGRWQILAGIGHAESGHGTAGDDPVLVTMDGTVRPGVWGPRLDGGRFARILDTDGGALDGDPDFDRAVGPMQIMPETWSRLGLDGNEDGVADPQNLHDAAQTAARYLCVARGGNLDDPEALRAALYSYNGSDEYVDKVVGFIAAYDAGQISP